MSSTRQRNIRTKRATSEEPSEQEQAGPSGAIEECLRDKLEETKLLQRMRKKTSGMGADKLAQAGPAVARAVSEEPDADAPEHVARLMDSYVKATTIQESNDDEHMKKFVEIELAKRLGKRVAGDELDEAEVRRRKVEEDLYSIPEHLKSVQQDVPLAGLMTGITEVVLPMEDRLKKIEETEAAKRRMLSAASKRAHLMPLDDERHEGVVEGKMRRGALPAVFGKAQQRRCDKDKDEMEALRRRVVTESRPLHKGRK